MNHSYTAIAKLFHWGMAVVFAGLIALGFVMTDMPLSPEKLQYYLSLIHISEPTRH